MSLALEYVAKIFIYIVAILVIIGLIYNFYVSAGKICLNPWGCTPKEEKCSVKTQIISESSITQEVLQKYCNFCLQKNDQGKCLETSVCYVIKGDFVYSPSISLTNCDLKCKKNVNSVIIGYNIPPKVSVEC